MELLDWPPCSLRWTDVHSVRDVHSSQSVLFPKCIRLREEERKKASKGLLRCLWIFPWQTIVSQCQVVGTGYFVCMKLCLGGMWGFVREGTVGESMITPTLFRFMVKTEGLLSMHVKGPRRAPPPLSRPAKANVYPNNSVLFFTSSGLCLLLRRDHRHSQAFTQVRLSFQTVHFTQFEIWSKPKEVIHFLVRWIQKHQSAGLILQQQSWLNKMQFHVFFFVGTSQTYLSLSTDLKQWNQWKQLAEFCSPVV